MTGTTMDGLHMRKKTSLSLFSQFRTISHGAALCRFVPPPTKIPPFFSERRLCCKTPLILQNLVNFY